MRYIVDAVTHRDVQTWTCWIVAVNYYSAELKPIIQFQYDRLLRFLVFFVHDVASPFCIVFIVFRAIAIPQRPRPNLAWKGSNVFRLITFRESIASL